MDFGDCSKGLFTWSGLNPKTDPFRILRRIRCNDAGSSLYRDRTLLIQVPEGKSGTYAIPDGVADIGAWAFFNCVRLSNVLFSGSITNIEGGAFYGCTGLRSVTIPASVASIQDFAFQYCDNLGAVYFEGDAPVAGGSSIFYQYPVTVYYLPGTLGWDSMFANRPTALWLPQLLGPGISSDGTNTQFNFNIQWAAGRPVVVEATANLRIRSGCRFKPTP